MWERAQQGKLEIIQSWEDEFGCGGGLMETQNRGLGVSLLHSKKEGSILETVMTNIVPMGDTGRGARDG